MMRLDEVSRALHTSVDEVGSAELGEDGSMVAARDRGHAQVCAGNVVGVHHDVVELHRHTVPGTRHGAT